MKRIQSAVAQLREPGFEPFISITNSENDSDLPDSQGTASAPASQDRAIFKNPELPPKKKRQDKGSEIAGLKAQVDILLKQQISNASSRNESVLRQELALLQRNFAVLQQELKRQRESSGNESMLQQEIDRRRQETIQREDQLREESKHQLAREKEESKQQLAREKEESKQRHAELMDLLKEQKEKTRSS